MNRSLLLSTRMSTMACVTYKAKNHHTTRHHRRETSALGSARQNRHTDPLHTTSAERRHTIAWHIARLPGGRIALALQYGHLRASAATEGYSGRARHGLRRVLDIETARAMADYLDDLAERVSHGEGVSGAAAPRMIAAVQASAARFQGLFLTPKMADAWRDDPRLAVYDNPDAFLTCNYDPAKALCRPGQAGRRQPPAIERCDPACANVARTDTHISRLREEITQLETEITSPLTLTPLRERLKQRVILLGSIAGRHERNRLTRLGGPGTPGI